MSSSVVLGSAVLCWLLLCWPLLGLVFGCAGMARIGCACLGSAGLGSAGLGSCSAWLGSDVVVFVVVFVVSPSFFLETFDFSSFLFLNKKTEFS